MRQHRWFAAAAVIVVLLVGWLAARGVLAQRHLTTARADLASAKTALLDRRLPAADAAIRKAGTQTAAARSLTADPIWRAASAVPVFGASLASAADISRAADEVARSVLPPALAAARTLDPKALRDPSGLVDVGLLQSAAPDLAQADRAAVTAERQLSHSPRDWLLPPISHARAELASQLATLSTALHGTGEAIALAPAFLGQDRPRRYFVLIQQNGESRGTGGLPGGFAIITAARGRLKLSGQGSNADLVSQPLPAPAGVPADYVKRYEEEGALDAWVNVNLSPDLPVVARVIADRWQRQRGEHIDGVVAVDAEALADILRGSPPIQVAGSPELTSANLVDYLAVGQYRDFATPAAAGGVDRSGARKQLLAAIGRAAIQRLVAGGGSTYELLRGLAAAAGSGHLRMASDDPALAPGLHDAGLDGSMPAGPAPVAYPVVINSAGGKLDHFLNRRLVYTAGSCGSPRRRSRIELDLTSSPPPNLPAYLTNPTTGLSVSNTSVNRLEVQLYATRGATFIRGNVDGQPLTTNLDKPGLYAFPFSEEGLPAWGIRVDVQPGTTRHVVLELDEPTTKGAARVPQQPLARPLRTSVAVPVC